MAPGRPAQLDGAQLDALGSALLQGAIAHGFGTELWTLKECARSSSVCTACVSVKCTSGACWGRWASARKSLSAAPLSATTWQCWSGNARLGPRSKKVCRRATIDRLHRRIGAVGTANPGSHLGA